MGTGKGAAAAGTNTWPYSQVPATFHLPVMLPSWACAVPVTPPLAAPGLQPVQWVVFRNSSSYWLISSLR